ncbi:MAG: AAA family ATPase [Hyphomicrobiales bacterium]
MNDLTENFIGAASVDLASLEGSNVPRVSIVAFCETQGAADTITAASADRRLRRATVDVRVGGIPRAVEFYGAAPSPELLVLESRACGEDLLNDLENLADVCDADTKVIVIGASNDVMLYRELVDRGIADYLVGPVSEVSIIAAISRVYRDSAPKKLGRTCAFIGAKGGAGASTVAHNVAWALAGEPNANIVLADMDLPFGTAGLDFNLDAEQGIAEAVGDNGRLDEQLLDRLLVRCNERLNLLAAPAMLGKGYDFDEDAFEQMLDIARANASAVVLDMPHVWTAWARRTLVAADEVVIVAEPTLADLRNAKSLVEILTQARPNDVPPRLVLNCVGMPKRPEVKPADFAAALHLEPLVRIAFDSALFGTAANKGQMIASVSAKSSACAAFAEVSRVLAGRSDPKARKGVFGSRLLKMLRLGRNASPAVTHSGART